MGNMTIFDAIIERKLQSLHCCYIGKVIATDGKTAKVQPLGLIPQTGKTRAVVDDVPVACRYKIGTKTITYSHGDNTHSQVVAVPTQIKAGDLVVCLCADWNVTAARKGNNELPPTGAHSISDSIIVGIL